jgi:hypothetical protein
MGVPEEMDGREHRENGTHLRRSLLAAILTILTIAPACTTADQHDVRPTPQTPVSTPGTSTGDELPFAGAPGIEAPLDTSRYEDDPCRTLTGDQAQSLDLPGTGTVNDRVALGVGCDWFNQETRGEVSINFPVEDRRGLSAEYDANNRGKWEYFQELPYIDGYPALIRAGTDDRDTGFCIVVVGVADDMAFESIVQLCAGRGRAEGSL